ncbi:MAG: hypothetical protein P4L98_15180 [Ancalomicrobiaceae bacterium]|nr:hypothetical protein [Ancalomicrobiaceae bacterium]
MTALFGPSIFQTKEEARLATTIADINLVIIPVDKARNALIKINQELLDTLSATLKTYSGAAEIQ